MCRFSYLEKLEQSLRDIPGREYKFLYESVPVDKEDRPIRDHDFINWIEEKLEVGIEFTGILPTGSVTSREVAIFKIRRRVAERLGV